MKNEPVQHIQVINAELSFDEQHGPIVTVTVDDHRISVYLTHETGTVTRSDGAQYGIAVKGPWHKFRQLIDGRVYVPRDYDCRAELYMKALYDIIEAWGGDKDCVPTDPAEIARAALEGGQEETWT